MGLMRRQYVWVVALFLVLAVPASTVLAEGIIKKTGRWVSGLFKGKDRGKKVTLSGSIDEVKEARGGKLMLKGLEDRQTYQLTGRRAGELKKKIGNFVTIEGNLREANKDRPLPLLEVLSYRDLNTGLSGQEMHTMAGQAGAASAPEPADEPMPAPEPEPAPAVQELAEPDHADAVADDGADDAVDHAAMAAYEQHEQPADEPQPASGSQYTVQKGDTLATIAKAQLGKASRWTEIKKLNKIADERKIKAGMVLMLPGK